MSDDETQQSIEVHCPRCGKKGDLKHPNTRYEKTRFYLVCECGWWLVKTKNLQIISVEKVYEGDEDNVKEGVKMYSVILPKDEMGDILTLINSAINDCHHKSEYPAIVYQAVEARESELFELRQELYKQLDVSDEAEFWEKAEESE